MSTEAVYPDLVGKISLVTGGGTGIGKATAMSFGKAGAIVVVADIDEERGVDVVNEIKGDGGEALFIKTDVSQSAQVKAMVDQVVSRYGRLDIAVNNAAVPPDVGTISNMDEEYFQRLISVNLTGVAFCLKWELRQMQSQKETGGGSIINLASVSALKADPNMPAYTTAKHGIVGLTRVAAIENGPYGIRVNAIAPGAVSTELAVKTITARGATVEDYAPHVGLFGRFAQPAEIAQVILWLGSSVSAYMTGVLMPVDSGFSIV